MKVWKGAILISLVDNCTFWTGNNLEACYLFWSVCSFFWWWHFIYANYRVVRFFDFVDFWVINIKEPMNLCARSTSTSSAQSKKRKSHSENIRKVCLLYTQNNKIVWLSYMADILFVCLFVCLFVLFLFFEKFTGCAKVCKHFFLDCAFPLMIGWAGKLWSHGTVAIFVRYIKYKGPFYYSGLYKFSHSSGDFYQRLYSLFFVLLTGMEAWELYFIPSLNSPRHLMPPKNW